MDIIFFNAWKVMAQSDDPIEADRDYWVKTDLINHDFAPEVKLGLLKTVFSKIMCRIFKIVF